MIVLIFNINCCTKTTTDTRYLKISALRFIPKQVIDTPHLVIHYG